MIIKILFIILEFALICATALFFAYAGSWRDVAKAGDKRLDECYPLTDDNSERYNELIEKIQDAKANALIWYVVTFCSLFAVIDNLINNIIKG